MGLRSGLEALSALPSEWRQTVETRQRRARFGVHNRDVEIVNPGKDIADYWEHVTTTPLILAGLLSFAYDVTEPGLRITGNEQAETYLEDEWLPQAGILNGKRKKPFDPIIPTTVMQRWGRGGMLVEHVRDDPDDIGSPITGINPIRPETGQFVTLPNKEIIVEPEDVDHLDNPVMTRRDEPAGFIQWHPDAIRAREDRDAVPLSTNDFSRSVLSLDIGADNLGGVWGTPITEVISDDVAGFKDMLRNNERAVRTKAWGLWVATFGRETIEYQEDGRTVTEVIEWAESDQDEWVDDHLEDLDPGGIVTQDGTINLDNLAAEVPDIIPQLRFYVSNITTALPTPLFIVGFEKDINQFVTERQDQRYQRLIDQERKEIGTFLTQLLRHVYEHNTGNDAGDLKATIEPPEEESPILSMSDDEMERLDQWSQAAERVERVVGVLVDEEYAHERILHTNPDEAMPDIDEDVVSAEDEEVQEQIAELREAIQGDGGEEGQPPQDPPQQPPQPPTEADD